MEILILGVLLVALMVYVSTRIKKSAAQAFEAETIDAGEFTIVKPEGFLNPIDDKSAFAFEAYSKDFGKGENMENVRQAQAFVSVSKAGNLAEAGARAKKEAGEILSEESGGQICTIKSRETLENASAYNFYKIAASEKNKNIYELKITVLEDFLDDYQNRVDEMLESFRLK